MADLAVPQSPTLSAPESQFPVANTTPHPTFPKTIVSTGPPGNVVDEDANDSDSHVASRTQTDKSRSVFKLKGGVKVYEKKLASPLIANDETLNSKSNSMTTGDSIEPMETGTFFCPTFHHHGYLLF